MARPLGRAAGNLRRRWRRILVLCVIGAGVLAPFATGSLLSLPVVWFLGLFVLLPVLHTLAKPLPDPGRESDGGNEDPALAALRERYARGEIDETEFERRLERLLETEDAETRDRTPAVVAGERVRRTVERHRE